jgi:hypothetical protein
MGKFKLKGDIVCKLDLTGEIMHKIKYKKVISALKSTGISKGFFRVV